MNKSAYSNTAFTFCIINSNESYCLNLKANESLDVFYSNALNTLRACAMKCEAWGVAVIKTNIKLFKVNNTDVCLSVFCMRLADKIL
jgi:hypothetical protein